MSKELAVPVGNYRVKISVILTVVKILFSLQNGKRIGTRRYELAFCDPTLCAMSQGVIKGPGGTISPPAHSDDSHQPLTQSWNTISSWTSPNQWEIYQIKPHFDQIGTVIISQWLWSLTAVVFGFWKNQARGCWESSEWACVELVPPGPFNTPLYEH